MRLVEGSVSLRVPLLLLGLWVVLAPVQSSQGHSSWSYISSEVVIPREELHLGKGVRIPGWLSYSLSFGGQRHVIHMRRKKLFWPRDLLIMTQNDQGALQMDYAFVPLDCYYLGYLEDVPLSMVTVDTCYGGLDGIMKLDDLAYEIKPLKDSHRFEHIVSQIVADTDAIGPMFPLGHKEERHPLSSQVNVSLVSRVSSKLYASHGGKIKGCFVFSYSTYTMYSNVTKCVEFLIQIGNIMDTLLRGMDLKLYISLILIYDKRDPTHMNNFNVPDGPFAKYYLNHIYPSFTPHAIVVMNKDSPHELQFNPTTYHLCWPKGIVFMAHLNRHHFLLSIIATHQVSKLFGLFIDGAECICQRRTTCIMYRYPVLTDSYSNCSYFHMQNVVSNTLAPCLYVPAFTYYNQSLVLDRCGNYLVEGTEQCDCGSFKECYNNPCCNNDCTFTPGTSCNIGKCCANCTNVVPGTMCRTMQSICDLPEYCPGSTPTCPADVYLQDGTPCTEDGYCYHGNCTDRSLHCKEIFGRDAENGPDHCYSMNKKSNRFGHCGITFSPKLEDCGDADIKCGRLQCVNVTHLPRLQQHVGFHQSLISGTMCFGVGSHRGSEATDVGAVRSGTLCDDGKFCLDSHCSGTVSDINYDCPPSKCNFHGVCNNRNNCHCHVGWEPPMCIEIGAGGSVDSGPPPGRMRSVRQSRMSVIYLRVVFGRLYLLIASLLFGVATNVRYRTTTSFQTERADQK